MQIEETITPYSRIILIAIIVGLISGLGALFFFEGLRLGTAFFMEGIVGFHLPKEGQTLQDISQWAPPDHLWMILPVICFGGLLSGLLVYTFAPEAEGHGTDAAIKAFHGEGRVRWRVPLVKAVTAVLTISTGGSAGREGPTAQMSAGFGSIAADLLGLSARERRLAIATGVGAGIGTIFMAPLGGAILAAEILYKQDFEAEAIVPAFLASVIGYAIFGLVEGFEPVFGPWPTSWNVYQVPLFVLLGVVSTIVGLIYINTFYGTNRIFKDIFSRLNLPNHFKPLAGAFLTGTFVLALAALSPEAAVVGLGSLGTGYGFTQLALYNMLPIGVLLFLPFAKILTTSLTIGSGGSGGVFAPGLVIGGATGGAFGSLLHLALPGIVPAESVPVFVVVGMIALFGAISHAPIAVMIMVVEMTGDFSLLVPAMGAVSVAVLLIGQSTIFREQVLNRSKSAAHRDEYMIEILQDIHVSDVMVPRDRIIAVSPGDTTGRVLRLIDETLHTGFPVLDGEGKLVGMIALDDVRDNRINGEHDVLVEDVMSSRVFTVHHACTLREALALMTEHDIHHLPVVPAEDPRTLLGFVTRTDVMKAYVRRASQSGEKRRLTGNSTLIGPGTASENSPDGKKGSVVEG
ncbi:chloride channel protein [Methanoculleus sp.]|uniref:chloride channel protein n=1 Tax=Methanoculleus sp. TaxID=90427 RepID=UPI001BD2C684|nr:chloride channel protein [Methanoculleus sp.]